MVGTSTVSAPIARSRSTRPDAWWRARVTTTRRPNRGRDSNQGRSSAATFPITIVTGGSRGQACSSPRVVRMVRWSGRVPHRMAATGVSAGAPPAISRSAISARWATPMRTTMVSPTRARASQSMSSSTWWRLWPVTTVNDVDRPRWVTGMPA